MFATAKSRKNPQPPARRFHVLAPAMIGFLFLMSLAAELRATDAPNPVFVQRADQNFHTAKARLDSDANTPTALWQFARAAFDWADVQTADAKRADIAN